MMQSLDLTFFGPLKNALNKECDLYLRIHTLGTNGYVNISFYFRYYTTQDLIYLVETEEFWAADVFITPPNDGMDSEENSDDDESPSANVNYRSGRQMQSEASLK